MNFDLMFQPFRKYAVFQGRARRAEYWSFVLFIVVVAVVAVGLNELLFAGNEESPLVILLGLCIVGVFVPALALRVRRLHDTNRTGWWLLINIIPFIGPLTLFIFDVLPGTVGPNRFGPDPTGRSQDQLVEVF